MSTVYLDHNATTPPRPEAIAAVMAALNSCGNASSIHHTGQSARHRLNEARAVIARAINLPKDGRIIFTSGGTEANHLALNLFAGPIFRSAVEHDSVRAAAPEACVIGVNPAGRVRLDLLENLLAAIQDQALVSVMAANNETGVVQPIEDVIAIAHRNGAFVHCDAVQGIGKMSFDMTALGADLVSLSAHKLGGPQGAGALAVAPGVIPTPLLRGGGQEAGFRAGTENLPGIAGFAAAIAKAIDELDGVSVIAERRDRLEAMLLAAYPQAIVIGGDAPRLPNTCCIALPGVAAETQVIALDLDGIAVGAGAACSSGKVAPSHVLAAMGAAPAIARSAIRISLGRTTTDDDIDRCAAAWGALAGRLAAA